MKKYFTLLAFSFIIMLVPALKETRACTSKIITKRVGAKAFGSSSTSAFEEINTEFPIEHGIHSSGKINIQ